MARMMLDCSRFPSKNSCSVRISGDEGEVERLAVLHAVDAHGERDTPQLRDSIRRALQPESYAAPAPH
jgi:predicted small metal-binding protein